ncbi:hypothetical protein RGQ29_004122 [Quercus rubra]|uniref:Bidirectional sugar transporter SWEET n=1 Tax=Quercus rubra TaxID=3512 RepID=A0AAN7EDF3_QUERU|nr:hypothetical protein RGQ29_004122 [Quercus rubra]
MVNTETSGTIVGIIGNVISFALYISPIPTFIKIHKATAVESFKPDPYVTAVILSCAMWCFCGMPFVHPDNLLVISINGFGFIFEIIYITIFFFYSPWSKRREIILALVIEIIFFVLVVILTLKLFHTTKDRSTIVGVLSIILNILMNASPLSIGRVIRTKSVKYMPFFISLAYFCNGVIWVIYAILKLDVFILVPNSCGAVLGLMQLILYASYYKSTQWDPTLRELQLGNA